MIRNEAATAKVDSKELSELLRETRVALKNAEARVVQLQQKVCVGGKSARRIRDAN